MGLSIGKVDDSLGNMSRLEDAIRKAIEDSEESRYSISKGSGVSEPQLSRFVNGTRGLSVDTIEQLADYLGLDVVLRPKPRRKSKVTR